MPAASDPAAVSAPPRRPARPSPALRLTAVTVWEWDARLRQRQPILTDIDWSVGPGEQWAVLGPNGAGKSTLLDIAAGMRHPSRGAVEILGETVGRVDLRALRERIGHVDVKTEEAFSPRRTALDVVLTGATGTIQVLRGAARRGGARAGGAAARAVRLRRRRRALVRVVLAGRAAAHPAGPRPDAPPAAPAARRAGRRPGPARPGGAARGARHARRASSRPRPSSSSRTTSRSCRRRPRTRCCSRAGAWSPAAPRPPSSPPSR